MKNYSVISVLVIATALFTGCIKETMPTSIATAEQVAASPSALEASVRGIPAIMATADLGGTGYAFDMGYPGLMIMLDSVTGELVDTGNTGYDWYSYWSQPIASLGELYVLSSVPWRTLYVMVKAANDVIGAINPEEASETQLKYLGQAYAYRALFYLNLVRMYEYKAPTDPNVDASYKPEGNIAGLAVPIVTEKTTQEEARNNPRATVDKVYELIFSDLDAAESYLEGTKSACDILPSLAVVYGLKARAYLERGSAGVEGAFASAAEYARKGIDAFGGSPLTQSQWEDPTNGFNNAGANNNSWMWYVHYDSENIGNLTTFVAHMAPEETWTSYGWSVGRGINKSLYEKINDTDFRKHSWIDPDKKNYYDYKVNRDVFGKTKTLQPYCNLKFRPAQGNCDTWKTGGASEVPLMRVEELMLIEAEGLGMSGNLPGGIAALEKLIQTRDPEYACTAANAFTFQREVYLQKRIELWGEGLIYFDAKRLQAGMRNGYLGTNVQEGYRFTVTGVAPAWNFVIPRPEINANPALDGLNNPDPTNVVLEWTE